MQFSTLLVIVSLIVAAVLAVPVREEARSYRELSEKRQPKARPGYIRFGKRRVDPNAELLYLDQLLL